MKTYNCKNTEETRETEKNLNLWMVYLTTDDIKTTEADILKVSNFSISDKICSIRQKNESLGSTLQGRTKV